MYNFLSKNGQLIAFLLGLLLVVIFVISAITGMNSYADTPTREVLYESSIFDIGLIAAHWLTILGGILMVLFIIRSVIMNPKGSLPLIIAAVAIAVIFFVFRGMDSGEITKSMYKYGVSAAEGGIVSGGLWVAIIMFFGAWIVLILSEIRGMFR